MNDNATGCRTRVRCHVDNDGNLTSETDGGSSYTYAYDRDGRMASQTGPGFTTSYKYDAFGRRIEQTHNGTVTKFVYDGDHVLVELNSSNATTARYTLGPRTDEVLSMRRGGATYHYLHDAQGSVVRILDASRAVKNSYEYLPWGEIRTQSETVTNRYGYAGREKNPDGRTMHYRARTYLPHLGRFAQEDPAGFVDGVNLYRYVRNSPCNFTDPTGEGPIGTIIGTGMGVFGYYAETSGCRAALHRSNCSSCKRDCGIYQLLIEPKQGGADARTSKGRQRLPVGKTGLARF